MDKPTPFHPVKAGPLSAQRGEERLRTPSRRMVQVQEAERASIARDLHDTITQPLIGVLFRSQALVILLAAQPGPAKHEAARLRTLLAQTATAVERISRHLRPSILDQFGLFAVLRATCTEFEARSGVVAELTGAPLFTPLPHDIELALYRILQEALNNVEKHARARHVSVVLGQPDNFIQLAIKDDGIGFDAGHQSATRNERSFHGIEGMRIRAAYAGGTFTVKSSHHTGTEITVRIPRPPITMAVDTAA